MPAPFLKVGSTMTRIKLLLASTLASTLLFSACSSGLDQTPLIGEVTFQGWDGPLIAGATLWLRVYEQSSPGTKGLLFAEYTERGVNLDPVQHPRSGHPISTNIPTTEEGETYLIEVHVDIDLDGVSSPGDAVTVEPVPFEGKDPLDPVVVPVVRVR